MRAFRAFGVLALLALSGCAGLSGRDELSSDFDKETRANEARVSEDKTRTALRTLESAVADYVKTEHTVPAKLDALIPKYLPEIPPLDVPDCGGESDKVEVYPASVLRDGEVDGSAIKGTGRWGYVFDGERVVVFVDCRKPSLSGTPWYQVRGVY
jgi:hypothetical protein